MSHSQLTIPNSKNSGRLSSHDSQVQSHMANQVRLNASESHTLQLLRAGPSVVKSRNGNVLSRGFILKTDYYPTERDQDLELNLHGAPNFRACAKNDVNVFGTAQPRVQGLKAILSVLHCRPDDDSPSHCCWISTREEPIVYIAGKPFVLRDAAQPTSALILSDRAENLEAIENRLKMDILAESSKFGGVVLTHNELEGSKTLLPTWTAVDSHSVKTARETWEHLTADGWKLEYHRIPIASERLIEDNYLDAYVRILTSSKVRSVQLTAVVFNCGMGVVRTTFAMVAAALVRRKQLMRQESYDPFRISTLSPDITRAGSPIPVHTIEQATLQQELSKSLLKLTSLLQQNLSGNESLSVTETLHDRPALLANLRKAHMGNYSIIMSLLGCLNNGFQAKRVTDNIIDACAHVTHLRDSILSHRVKASLSTANEARRNEPLARAVKALEKYFFLIAFSSYIEDQVDFKDSFFVWLKARVEIWNQLAYLRNAPRTKVLAPVNDLSALSGRDMGKLVSGAKIIGDEYASYVIHNRKGVILRSDTVLKSDQWLQEAQDSVHAIRGVINFRNILGTNIYASGQPTIDAVDLILQHVSQVHQDARTIVWIALREEPVVYINGSPYCLRRDEFTLRNMKDFGGISPSRLELLEQRLKADVLNELEEFEGKLLLHTESHGDVFAVWEETSPESVNVMKEIMEIRSNTPSGVMVQYHRVPITAEQAPDFSDISDILRVVIESNLSHTPIILNDQLGRGRSTMASIIVVLIQQWIAQGAAPIRPSSSRRSTTLPYEVLPTGMHPSYQIINNVLRIIKNGLMVKATVDAAIDQCAPLSFNLLDSIEDSRIRAEQASDFKERKKQLNRGRHNLRRYYTLILFQAYLDSITLDDRQKFETFEQFIRARPVLQNFEKDFLAFGDSLKLLEPVNFTHKSTLPDEVQRVLTARSGAVLGPSTILKADYFPGLEKLSLVEKIEGSPNFRFVNLLGESLELRSPVRAVCGSGMPTLEGLCHALRRLSAHPQGSSKVFWTSLREEPVVYVAGKPHVLRLEGRPLENIEATGISTQLVEAMEITLRNDTRREVGRGQGTLLLHDEEERQGSFLTVPVWENVEEVNILTPRDVYNKVIQEGYQVDYDRIAITDEQAPLPEALAQLQQRVTIALKQDALLVFNCQMGRGRTTTGMVVAALVTWTMKRTPGFVLGANDEDDTSYLDAVDGRSEEVALLQGEYKTILKLVGVLSNGRVAKKLADQAIDTMSAIQNLRKAIYDYKLKVDVAEVNSTKRQRLTNVAFNYLHRYATLIVFANYLLERSADANSFPMWLKEHREITTILNRLELD